jgi:hypothetical protein
MPAISIEQGMWIGVGDESDKWAHQVSDIAGIPGRDYSFSRCAKQLRVQFRPEFNSSGYKRQGFEV